MHNAASKNSLNVARLLIDGGANIEAQDNRGDTPLGSTARKNSRDVARLLIERGVNTEGIDLIWMN